MDRIDGQDKDKFYIFDFCGNFEIFQNEQRTTVSEYDTLSEVLFTLKFEMAFKLQDLKYQTERLIAYRKALVEHMAGKVKELNRENFAVRQHLKYVDTYSYEVNYQSLCYEDTLLVREEIAPLIEPENDDLKNYKAKAEYYVRQHQDNTAIAKLKNNIPLMAEDVQELDKILWSEVGTKADYSAEYGDKPLGKFAREIVGLDMAAAKAAFAEYLDETNLDSRQIYFVNQIVEFIVHNGMMKELSVLQETPFTDQRSIVEVFQDLSVWMGIRKVIEKVNANAMVA